MTEKEAKSVKVGDYVYHSDIFGGIEKLEVVSDCMDSKNYGRCVPKFILDKFPGNYHKDEESAIKQDFINRTRYDSFLFSHWT